MSSLLTNVNLTSLSIQTKLGRTNSDISRALERISSGTKLNKASDDPSAFSISEKMRSHIKGFKTTLSNTQNAVSYLQTAEGAANEITSMLHRMKELSVQGANGVYTSNDRIELQKEIDQLKEEINRISATTEYNSKKLLDGSSSGIWNSNSSNLGAILNGTIIDGNYDISMQVEPGKNQILQSHILTLRKDAIGVEVKDKGNTNISNASSPIDLEPKNGDYTLNISDIITAGDTAEIVGKFIQEGSNFMPGTIAPIPDPLNPGGFIPNPVTDESGYMQIEFTEDNDNAGAAGLQFKMRFISSESGKEGPWQEFTTGANNSLSATYTAGGFNVSFSMPIMSGVSSKVQEGDKLLIAISDNKDMVAGDRLLISGGGTLQLTQNGVKGPFVTFDNPNSITKPNNDDGIVDSNKVTLHTMSLDSKTGSFLKGELSVSFQENSVVAGGNGVTLSGIVTIDLRGSGEPVTSTTRLQDIENFIDPDGNDIFANSQSLELYGNSKNIKIYLEGADTISDLERKFTEALVEGLEMGSKNAAINQKLVEFNSFPNGEGLNAVGGKLTIQGALTGNSSEVAFVGNQKLIDALGFSPVQKSENNITKAVVKDNLNGVVVGSRVFSGDIAKEVVAGTDLFIDSRSALEVKWDNNTSSINFVDNSHQIFSPLSIHMVDKRTEVQIGLVEGELLDITVPQIDTESLGISNSNVSTLEEAGKSITDMDNAINKIVSIRGKIGADINRLGYAQSSLTAGRDNLVESESRIRDTDIATETTALTTAQVMSQAGIAVLAQANQIPQLALSLLRS